MRQGGVVELLNLRIEDGVAILALAVGVGQGAPPGRALPLDDAALVRLVESAHFGVRVALELKPSGLVIDGRNSLQVWSPGAVDALGKLVASVVAVGLPVGIVHADTPLSRLQLGRAAQDYGGRRAVATATLPEALQFVRNPPAPAQDSWTVSTGVRSAPPRDGWTVGTDPGRKSKP